MENPLIARRVEPLSQGGFRETSEGAVLGLGSVPVVRETLLVGGVFGVLTIAVLLMMAVAAQTGSAVSPWTFGIVAMAVAATGGGVACAGLRQRGPWSLTLDGAGLRMERGRMRPHALVWSSVTRVRFGPVAAQRGRYRVDLADGRRIEGRRPQDGIYLDTVRFRTSADDLDLMTRAVRDAAERRAIPTERFPRVGRGPS